MGRIRATEATFEAWVILLSWARPGVDEAIKGLISGIRNTNTNTNKTQMQTQRPTQVWGLMMPYSAGEWARPGLEKERKGARNPHWGFMVLGFEDIKFLFEDIGASILLKDASGTGLDVANKCRCANKSPLCSRKIFWGHGGWEEGLKMWLCVCVWGGGGRGVGGWQEVWGWGGLSPGRSLQLMAQSLSREPWPEPKQRQPTAAATAESPPSSQVILQPPATAAWNQIISHVIWHHMSHIVSRNTNHITYHRSTAHITFSRLVQTKYDIWQTRKLDMTWHVSDIGHSYFTIYHRITSWYHQTGL